MDFDFLDTILNSNERRAKKRHKMSPIIKNLQTGDDIFIADIGEMIPKCDIASLENPLFTLSKKPDLQIREYKSGHDSVKIIPSSLGLATIHDKDILIYCISRLMKCVNRNILEAEKKGQSEFEQPPRTILFKVSDFLKMTGRSNGGSNYERLHKGLIRLAGTVIITNIKTGDKRIDKGFGIIESFEMVGNRDENGILTRMDGLKVELSQWLYNSILYQDVLKINAEYFNLSKPIERRVYEIARKHCGNKKSWAIGLDKLHSKTGSTGEIRAFKQRLKAIQKNNPLPDYLVSIDGNNVVFTNRNIQEKIPKNTPKIALKESTIERAKSMLHPLGLDYHGVVDDFLHWSKLKPKPQSIDGAFIGFCKQKVA